MPTFNELYYVGYGNPDLKPEDAWLTDLGVDFERPVTEAWTVNAKLDAFYNRLTNKISSAPTPEDPNIWQPYNIGKVRSAGFDLVAGFAHEGEWKGWSLDPLWQMRAGRTDGYGAIPSWNTLDLTLSKSFNIRNAGVLGLYFSLRNVLDNRYEVVSGYPMQGRSIIGGIDYKF